MSRTASAPDPSAARRPAPISARAWDGSRWAVSATPYRKTAMAGTTVDTAAATPDDLLALAGAVMAEPHVLPPGLWQHAAALLARRALEGALAAMWRETAPGVEDCPARFQLLCLPAYLDDADVAGRASHVWWSLDNACRHRPYELEPTAVELRGWLETV